ncbi:hypothetical protein KGF57_002315 [Candida theae]|uniref:Rhodanese domain-containing protein n=1 Tax=Candida theae TaxID=1198502 RepID=A0AAD5FYW4_9ASCO|nr:uncharacterized protein KGF57_002315 [Candida theae]KAI5958881.1 hypothetical protein KGF57_002315 [Candida theae]
MSFTRLSKQIQPIARTAVARQTASLVSTQLFRHFTVPSVFNATKPVICNSIKTSFRTYSVLTESPEAKVYKYDDVKEIATNPSKHPDSVLVDVREPVEYDDGHIPGAINVPFKSSPGALDLSEDDFLDNFGFEKPEKNKELVFYCLGGVRSTAAEELANTFGYKKRGNYVGSYEDWVAHENKNKSVD